MTRPGIEPRSPGPLANTLEGVLYTPQSSRTGTSQSSGLISNQRHPFLGENYLSTQDKGQPVLSPTDRAPLI